MKTVDPKDKNKELFNISRYLLTCYENHIEPDSSLMKSIDFSETSNIQIHYYSEDSQQFINYKVEETLAQNCMNNLPFEVYEKFITADWIDYTNDRDQKLIKSAIFRKNFPLIKRIHDLGLSKALVDQSYASNFFNAFYNPLFNLSHNLDRINQYSKKYDFNKEFISSYYNLLKESYCEIKYFQSHNLSNKTTKIKYIKNPEWLYFAINCSNHLDEEYAYNNLFNVLTQQEYFYPIFEDAFQQLLKKRDLDSVKKTLGISKNNNKDKEKNILNTAIANGNFQVIELLVNTLSITQKDIIKALNENIDNNIYSILNFKNNDISDLSFLINNNYVEMKKRFFPTTDSNYFPLFIFGNNKECINTILQNKEHYLNQKTLKNCSAFEIIALAKILHNYKQCESELGYKLDLNLNNNRNEYRIIFLIADNIANKNNKLFDLVSLEDLPNSSWERLSNLMTELNSFGKKVIESNNKEVRLDFNENETNSFLNQFRLNTQLKNNLSNEKKKIKV